MSRRLLVQGNKERLHCHNSVEDTGRANVPLRAGMEGEKKYSPPFGTTQSAVKESSLPWVLGFVPDIVRATPVLF